MGGFNLSRWALTHRSLTVFLMLVFVAGGAMSFLNIGRGEDPDFTIRTMVVAAAWPGASVEETTLQVTERLERTLQEVPNVDYLESYTVAGRTIVFVHLLGSTNARDVWYTWYEVRKRIGDRAHELPQGVQGPFFDDDFGDTFGIIY
ncbi:MAG: efflux RND transporter permease subunit, partial [Geminicoccaceae bacterium]